MYLWRWTERQAFGRFSGRPERWWAYAYCTANFQLGGLAIGWDAEGQEIAGDRRYMLLKVTSRKVV